MLKYKCLLKFSQIITLEDPVAHSQRILVIGCSIKLESNEECQEVKIETVQENPQRPKFSQAAFFLG
jgi:hypothetical protein